MNTVHVSNSFTAPLTAQTNLLEPNLYLALIMVACVLGGLLFARFALHSLLTSPGIPVRVKCPNNNNNNRA